MCYGAHELSHCHYARDVLKLKLSLAKLFAGEFNSVMSPANSLKFNYSPWRIHNRVIYPLLPSNTASGIENFVLVKNVFWDLS
jgi:hypothetical protein